jgi:hypothetical protein
MISSDRRCALSRPDRDGGAVDDEGQEVALKMIEPHYPTPNGIRLGSRGQSKLGSVYPRQPTRRPLEASCYASDRPQPGPSGFPLGSNRLRGIEPVPVVAVTLAAWCPCVPRRAFGNGGGPSPLETGTVSRSGFWLRIALSSEATMGLALFVA